MPNDVKGVAMNTAGGLAVYGYTLNEWVAILAAVYLLAQLGLLVPKYWQNLPACLRHRIVTAITFRSLCRQTGGRHIDRVRRNYQAHEPVCAGRGRLLICGEVCRGRAYGSCQKPDALKRLRDSCYYPARARCPHQPRA